jgi:uncharacterized membrane protein
MEFRDPKPAATNYGSFPLMVGAVSFPSNPSFTPLTINAANMTSSGVALQDATTTTAGVITATTRNSAFNLSAGTYLVSGSFPFTGNTGTNIEVALVKFDYGTSGTTTNVLASSATSASSGTIILNGIITVAAPAVGSNGLNFYMMQASSSTTGSVGFTSSAVLTIAAVAPENDGASELKLPRQGQGFQIPDQLSDATSYLSSLIGFVNIIPTQTPPATSSSFNDKQLQLQVERLVESKLRSALVERTVATHPIGLTVSDDALSLDIEVISS